MNLEFDQLSQKVQQLIQLVENLRVENEQLRLQLAHSSTQNVLLSTRMQEAHQRISSLLEPASMKHDQDNREFA